MIPQRLKWTPELVERFWDGFSQTRLTECSFSKLGGVSVIAAIAHLLSHDSRIVDFGAGDGHLAELIVERGFMVATYDPSMGRVRNLKTKLWNRPGFLGVADPESSEKFDVVLLIEVIEHVLDEELQDTLHRVSALTKPGGLLIVTTPNNEDLELGMSYCPVSNLLFHRWQHVRSFTRATLCELLNRFGYTEVVTHFIGFDNAIFEPFDPVSKNPPAKVPDYIKKLRRNESTRIGNESTIMYIGRRDIEGV
jgi:2-polyprenyl-3-methyl-5-hydroxy-6-metoxy-1,4-benzoquinol methylase